MGVALEKEPIGALEARLRESEAQGPSTERVDLLTGLAFRLRETEDFDRMLELANAAREMATSLAYERGLAYARGISAFVHYMRADYRQSLADCLEALRYGGEEAAIEGRVRSVLAMVHWSIGNFDEALTQVDRALELLRQVEDHITVGFALTARGGILQSLKEYDEALKNFEEAYDVFVRLEFTVGIARALSALGSVHLLLNSPEIALEFHKRSLELVLAANHQIGMSRAFSDLGETYQSFGDHDQALRCHLRALEIRLRGNYRQAQTTSFLNLGKLYRIRGDREEALDHFQRGLAIAEEIGARPRACQFHLELSGIYEQTGDLGMALLHFKSYEKTKAELFLDQSAVRHKAIQLEAQIASVQKDAEIHRLRNVELATLIDELRRTQAELVNSEKLAATGDLVAALAHEINSPLGVIVSASDVTLRCAAKLQESGKCDLEALRTNAKLVSEAAKRIQTVVRRLKSFTGIDQAEYTYMDLHQALDDVIALVEPEFGGRVQVHRVFNPVPRIFCYAAELNQVFVNLVRNAGEAIEQNGRVQVSTEAKNGRIDVIVADNGRGISRDQLNHLFNPGFSTRDRRVKASLSLFTCLNIVQRHGGTIDVTSEPGQGSTFTVRLPRELEREGAISVSPRP